MAAAPDPVARDGHGVARGGVRYPHVEVPIARVDGLPNAAPPEHPERFLECLLSGRTLPFAPEQLTQLYPTADAYVTAFAAAAQQAVADGHLLPEDADLLSAGAASSPPIGR